MPSSYRPLAVVAAVGAAVLCLGACSGSVSESDLEARIASELFTGFGAYPSVSCDGDLPAEVDATATCSALDTETLESIDLVATVTAVDGSTVNYRIEPVG
jgi:hypothetical protein